MIKENLEFLFIKIMSLLTSDNSEIKKISVKCVEDFCLRYMHDTAKKFFEIIKNIYDDTQEKTNKMLIAFLTSLFFL
jgi:hypothetical protein